MRSLEISEYFVISAIIGFLMMLIGTSIYVFFIHATPYVSIGLFIVGLVVLIISCVLFYYPNVLKR